MNTQPSWLPTKEQIDAHIARQRAERIAMRDRIDGPLSIYAPVDKPLRKEPEFVDSFPPADEDFSDSAFVGGLILGAVFGASIVGMIALAVSK